jgi:general secretion pathway protein M
LRCAGLWAATVLVPVLIIVALMLPWSNHLMALDERLVRSQDQLQSYRRLVATLPALQAELEAAQANDDYKAFYFDAQTTALAGARLQSEVQDIVRGAGARPISTQVLPINKEEQPPRVRIRTQLQGTTDALLEVLYSIEAARPFLFVDQMSIRSTTPRATPTRRSSRRVVRRRQPQAQVGQLTVRLDIFGYALGGGDE